MMRRASTFSNEAREVFVALWMRRDIPTERIAQTLGVTRQAVSDRARRLGLPPRTGNKEPAKKGSDELFRRMWLAGVRTRDMAEYFGYSMPQGVGTRRRHLGLPPRTRRPGGQGHAGWVETIPISAFWEMEYARQLRNLAA